MKNPVVSEILYEHAIDVFLIIRRDPSPDFIGIRMTIPMQPIKTVFIAYIPVLHQGYLQLFKRFPEVKTLYLIGTDFLLEHRSIQKDLRSLSPEQIQKSIKALHLFEEVAVLTLKNVEDKNILRIIAPDEDISHELIDRYWSGAEIIYDNIFLRWDRTKSLTGKNVEPDVTISQDEFDQKMMESAYESAKKSSDWWRQTAAVLVKDKKVVAVGRNYHMPNDMQQYVDGDPRAEFGRGERPDLSSSLHAEATVIAEAAKKGISTEGCSLYATTFPCPYCAPVIAAAGIKKVYYCEGYSMIEGEEMLKSKGVEIVKVVRHP